MDSVMVLVPLLPVANCILSQGRRNAIRPTDPRGLTEVLRRKKLQVLSS